MEAKVKEEAPDKEYTQPTTTDKRKPSSGKERRSPEQEESRTSPTPGPPSPSNNGTAALSSTESLSPPLPEGRHAPSLVRLRRFLSALQHFATDVGADTAERVRHLICNLVAGTVTIEEFQAGVQECTNYPLRASVPGFLRALVPLAQRDLLAMARRAKQTPLQYVRSHEHLILEAVGDSGDIFQQPETATKRRASDPFYEAQTNGVHDEYPPMKRLCGPGGVFDYQCGPHRTDGHEAFDRRDGGITVRDVSSMNASLPEPRPSGLLKTDDEWKNINTMLNCILSMVEKTKRALAILQQRGIEPTENTDIKRVASEIMAAAVRQTEERVAEVRRRAEDAVNQVKRQALLELQRAVGAAETKALELERGKRHTPPPGDRSPTPGTQQNCCWNCGRKAQETCSGCNSARYCGAFCQHKDWENHHQVCSGRDHKPSSLVRVSPGAGPARAHTPLAAAPAPPPAQDRLINPDRLNSNERLTLTLSTQGLMLGKK